MKKRKFEETAKRAKRNAESRAGNGDPAEEGETPLQAEGNTNSLKEFTSPDTGAADCEKQHHQQKGLEKGQQNLLGQQNQPSPTGGTGGRSEILLGQLNCPPSSRQRNAVLNGSSSLSNSSSSNANCQNGQLQGAFIPNSAGINGAATGANGCQKNLLQTTVKSIQASPFASPAVVSSSSSIFSRNENARTFMTNNSLTDRNRLYSASPSAISVTPATFGGGADKVPFYYFSPSQYSTSFSIQAVV